MRSEAGEATTGEGDLLAAGRALSAAVRRLALHLRHHELDAAAIERVAAGLTSLTDDLVEAAPTRRPLWWQVDLSRSEVAGLHFRHHSPFGGDLNLLAPEITWVNRPGPDGQPGLAATVTLDALVGGPPESVHGGVVAGMFDEVLGATQSLAPDGGGFTGRLTVWYRALTPLDAPLTFHGWIDRADGRRILTRAVCHAGETLTAEAEGLFIRPVGGLPRR